MNVISNMNCHTDLVGSAMIVERISRQEALSKDALNFASLNLSVPGFVIHTKGVISHPNMDWLF